MSLENFWQKHRICVTGEAGFPGPSIVDNLNERIEWFRQQTAFSGSQTVILSLGSDQLAAH